MAIETKSKINSLLMNILPGGILFSEGLKKQGYSDQLMKQYRKSGWLTSPLQRGNRDRQYQMRVKPVGVCISWGA